MTIYEEGCFTFGVFFIPEIEDSHFFWQFVEYTVIYERSGVKSEEKEEATQRLDTLCSRPRTRKVHNMGFPASFDG